MTAFCDICEKDFIENKENFLVIKKPVGICSECIKFLYETYQHMIYEHYSKFCEFAKEVDLEIEESTMSHADKKLARQILNAYMTSNPNDKHSEQIRSVVGTIVSGVTDGELEKLAIDKIDGSFSEAERKNFIKLIKEYLNFDTADSDLNEIVTSIVTNFDQEEFDEDYFEDEAPDNDKLSLKKVDIKKLVLKVLNFIKGQDEGVVQIGRLIYRHVMRCLYNESHKDSILTIKENFIVVGPTGVGKTATIEEFCDLIGLPCVVVDMTAQTKSGYVGNNIEDAFKQLLKKANNDIKLAQNGIMILDECDKILENANSRSDDPGGTSVMFEMLKKVEGCDIILDHNTVFSSKNILFVCLGTFNPVYEARKKRKEGAKVIGFKSDIKGQVELGRFISEDFIKSGMPQEWIGRFPAIVEYKQLDKEALLDILRNSSKSAFVQNKKLLEFTYDVELNITSEGEEAIVEKALMHKNGARGLNRVITELLEDIEAKLIMGNEECKTIELGEMVSYK